MADRNKDGKGTPRERAAYRGAGLIAALLLAVVLVVIAAARSAAPSRQGESGMAAGPIGKEDFLTVEGSSLVNRRGEEVLLRGVNLGGWMIQECWMCPVTGADGEWGNLDTIEAFEANGLTEEQIQTLFDTYQENWITEYDLDIIAEAGANCVRVPFWYRNFMKNEAGDWIEEDLDQNPGFKRLDWIIEEAGSRGMYVILDLHGAPGGQSMNHCCGTVGRNDLYSSEECRNAMKKLWTAIAGRYRDNPAVAAYDIMNEPQNNDGFEDRPNYVSPWDQASWNQTNEVYREMVAAVREADPEHVISVEGIWRITNLPLASDEGWTNMLYQVHLYDDTKQFQNLADSAMRYGRTQGVAILVGEFSNLEGIDICEENRLNWTTWTYKGGKGSSGTWFWYSGHPESVNPAKDDFETALEKWGEAIRTENGFQKNSTVQLWKEGRESQTSSGQTSAEGQSAGAVQEQAAGAQASAEQAPAEGSSESAEEPGLVYDRDTLTYELVWSDEFDYEGEPDPEKWGYDEGGSGWGNHELQYYTAGDNAAVTGGKLIIEACKEEMRGKDYTSSRLVTRGKADWTYCRVEVCAKLPSGLGTWPAIWMLPTDNYYGGWPNSGEIDIMEHVGYDQDVIVQSVHNRSYHGGQSKNHSVRTEGVSEDFHVYALEWLPDRLIFFVDGEEQYTYDAQKFASDPAYRSWPFDKRMHLLLNLAFGGDWGGARGTDDSYFPVQFEIDYVRVYQSPEILALTGQEWPGTEEGETHE